MEGEDGDGPQRCPWELIRPPLPTAKPTGRPLADDRRTLNGILYVLHTGCCWKDLPDQYGSSRIVRFLGQGGLEAFSKVAYLLLAAIAVQLIRRGITEILQGMG